MTKLTLTEDGKTVLIIGKPPSEDIMAQLRDRLSPGEGVVEVSAEDMAAFIAEIAKSDVSTNT